MSEIAKHTPTPWVADTEPNQPEVLTESCKLIAVAYGTGTKHAEDAANAAFIVRACNVHDELVELLENAAAAMTGVIAGVYGDSALVNSRDDIEAALAKAKEQI